ncbi:MAG TPA: hypothetical protein VFU09_03660 [Candidatus Udaeobacter sp.]|nr:hypothetical protein [Candidatus Udaeobacter sp.]
MKSQSEFINLEHRREIDCVFTTAETYDLLVIDNSGRDPAALSKNATRTYSNRVKQNPQLMKSPISQRH